MPNQIYHSSPTPPIIYHQGKEYIGGGIVEGGGSIVWPDSLYWDFTESAEEQNYKDIPVNAYGPFDVKPVYDAVLSANTPITENGIYIDKNSKNIKLYMSPVKSNFSRVYEIEFGDMSINSTASHADIFCYANGTSNAGLIFKSNGKLAVWDGSWEESNIREWDYFKNSILKVKILSSKKWEIYKNNELIFAPNKIMSNTPNYGMYIAIGKFTIDNQSYYPMYVKNAKAYYEEEEE